MENLIKLITDPIVNAIYSLQKINSDRAELFFIDFDDLIGSYNNSFNSALIDFADLPNYRYVSLYQASIPKNYYMVVSPYSSFLVNSTLVTIPDGNYTYITLNTTVLALLNALGLGAWTITFNQTTGKYTFNNATVTSFTFNTDTDLNYRLGFSHGTFLFATGSLTSEIPINLQLTNVVVVQSSLVKARSQNSINQAILMSIPDTTVIGSPVVFEHTDPYGLRVPIENVGTQFTINLYDNNNRPLNIHSAANLVLAFYK